MSVFVQLCPDQRIAPIEFKGRRLLFVDGWNEAQSGWPEYTKTTVALCLLTQQPELICSVAVIFRVKKTDDLLLLFLFLLERSLAVIMLVMYIIYMFYMAVIYVHMLFLTTSVNVSRMAREWLHFGDYLLTLTSWLCLTGVKATQPSVAAASLLQGSNISLLT